MDHPMNAGKIREQFYAAGVTGVLALITLYFLLRTLRRSISVDEEALYTQDGKRIPYADMLRIDKRNWDTKDLPWSTIMMEMWKRRPSWTEWCMANLRKRMGLLQKDYLAT